MTPSINFLWKVCGKNVNDNDRAIQCEFCNYWTHIDCNNLDCIDYKFFQSSNDSWYCIFCRSHIFPFNSLKNNKNFFMSVSNFHNDSKPGKILNNEGLPLINLEFGTITSFSLDKYSLLIFDVVQPQITHDSINDANCIHLLPIFCTFQSFSYCKYKPFINSFQSYLFCYICWLNYFSAIE